MRYIKLYEDVENGYEKITRTSFDDTFYNLMCGAIRQELLSKQEKVLLSNIDGYDYEYHRRENEVETAYLWGKYGYPARHTIYKLKDEWFYINTRMDKDDLYYKCDQISGVINYIKSFEI